MGSSSTSLSSSCGLDAGLDPAPVPHTFLFVFNAVVGGTGRTGATTPGCDMPNVAVVPPLGAAKRAARPMFLVGVVLSAVVSVSLESMNMERLENEEEIGLAEARLDE